MALTLWILIVIGVDLTAAEQGCIENQKNDKEHAGANGGAEKIRSFISPCNWLRGTKGATKDLVADVNKPILKVMNILLNMPVIIAFGLSEVSIKILASGIFKIFQFGSKIYQVLNSP